ncbi:MAG: type II toxin-antitoxin system RelE/ParE family toxin [Muribaculaceae bacterium]|nr:type II toxin-antitoxin system RelE/ParE family toxin [Muribaculaceae bacterium]
METGSNYKSNIRTIFRSAEFDKFYFTLPNKVKEKFEYVFLVVQTVYNVSTKFVKHIENTDLYELRVSLGTNEYRTILFAIDHDNVIESTRIILLNGFLKKSSKDYKKQIEKATNILKNILQ